MNENRQWTFRTDQNGDKVYSLEALQDETNYSNSDFTHHTVSIHIPLDQSDPASIRSTSRSTSVQDPLSIFSDTIWVNTNYFGRDIRLLDVGIRKGDMVSMEAHAAHLALDTPHISIPTQIYNIVLQATGASPNSLHDGDMLVECASTSRFPDIVLGLEPETRESDRDFSCCVEEIVITAEQYIVEVESGKCVLLVKEVEHAEASGGVVLGWAALRGSEVVLDWDHGRLGFAKTNL